MEFKNVWKRMRKRLSALLSLAVAVQLIVGGFAFPANAESTDGLCENHQEHTDECGYVKGVPCSHIHTEECLKEVISCVHEHTDECYPSGARPASSLEAEQPNCGHVCSEESGCITYATDCQHQHDDICGYAKEEPCTNQCNLCNATGAGSSNNLISEATRELQSRIDNLPLLETVESMNREDQLAVYETCQEIMNIYETLMEEEQRQLDTSHLEELAQYFARPQTTSIVASGNGWNLDDAGILTIESDAGMTDWRSNGSSTHQDNVKSIVIQSGVTNIPQQMFQAYSYLKSVSISETVATMGPVAFGNCYELTEVTFKGNSSLEALGDYAFTSCDKLSKVSFVGSSSLKTIGESTFANSGLTEITIPKSVTTIEENAFLECAQLSKVSFEGTSCLDTIRTYAFAYTDLTEITIPESVGTIDERVFNDCTKLKKVIMKGSNPPNAGSEIFLNTQFINDNIKGIHVPVGALETYQTAWTDYTDYIEAHTYGTNWETSTENHWQVCTFCGEQTDMSSHTEDSGTVTTEPTGTEPGTRTYRCSVCGYTLRTESIPATGSGGDTNGSYSSNSSSDSQSYQTEHATTTRPVITPSGDGGSITSTTTTAVEPGGKKTTVTTKVTKDKNGNITGHTATVKAEHVIVTSDDTGSRITIKPSAAAINNAVSAAGASAEHPLGMEVELPQDIIKNQLSNQEWNQITVEVIIPDAAASHTLVKTGVAIENEILRAAGEAGKNISVIIWSESGAVKAVWTLDGVSMKESSGQSSGAGMALHIAPVQSQDPAAEVVKPSVLATGGENGLVIDLAGSGILPMSKLTVPATDRTGIKAGDRLNLYRFEQATERFLLVPQNNCMADANGNATIDLPVISFSVGRVYYVLLPESVTPSGMNLR